MTRGAPQGLKMGPFIWNVMYDDFLEMELLPDMAIVGFAVDAIIVYWSDNENILEVRLNDACRRAGK